MHAARTYWRYTQFTNWRISNPPRFPSFQFLYQCGSRRRRDAECSRNSSTILFVRRLPTFNFRPLVCRSLSAPCIKNRGKASCPPVRARSLPSRGEWDACEWSEHGPFVNIRAPRVVFRRWWIQFCVFSVCSNLWAFHALRARSIRLCMCRKIW